MDKKIVKVVVNPDNGKTYFVYEDGSHSVAASDVGDAVKRRVADKVPEPLQAAYGGFQEGADMTEAFDDLSGIEKDYPVLAKIGRALGLGSSVAGLAGLGKSVVTQGAKRLGKKAVKELVEDAPIDKVMRKVELPKHPTAPRPPVSKVVDDIPTPQKKAPVPYKTNYPLDKAGNPIKDPNKMLLDVEVPPDEGFIKGLLNDMRKRDVGDLSDIQPRKVDSAIETMGEKARAEWLKKELKAVADKEAAAAIRRSR